MERPLPLRVRSYPALLAAALEAGAEGLVALRDRDGVRHGIWVQRGYVVGAHVAGRFDPLLSLLAQRGVLAPEALRRCLTALRGAGLRSGALAHTLAGIEASTIHDALQHQLLERYAALIELAEREGHDAQLECGPVPADECSARLPLGTLQRRAARIHAPASPDRREEARRALRSLAKTLHPDRHAACDEATRAALTRALAEATAAYHRLR